MSIRKDPIYLSNEVYRWLWALAQAEVNGAPENGRIATPDEIADRILRRAIKGEYPGVVDHQKKIDELEKQLIKSLKTP